MGTVGTFDTFTTARLGIYAAQKGLSVTGNNISNINTVGYTRQRLDQVSLKTGGNDMYRSQLDAHVGTGALIRGINQIRDPYLDIRYRAEASSVGYTDKMLTGLDQVASILDEVGRGEDQNLGDGMLYAQLQKLAESLRGLSASAGTESNDTLVRTSADALVTLFNTYAGKLETLRQNTENGFKDDVTAVNEILTSIRDLNSAIRKSEIFGDNALELRDERNRQIDALSKYMQIDVTYSMEDIGAGQQVEKLTIRLGNANPDPNVDTDQTCLIDGIYGAQLEMPEKVKAPDGTEVDNEHYFLNVTKLVDSKNREPKDTSINAGRPVTLDDNDLYGSLQATRELLTGNGTFSTQDTIDNVDENAAIERGIPFYQKSLDLLARQFAKVYNDLNQGHAINQKGEYVYNTGDLDEKGNPIYKTLEVPTIKYYVDAAGNYLGLTNPGGADVKEIEVTLNRNINDNAKQAFDDWFKAGGTVGTSTATYADTKDFLDQNGETMNGGPLFSIRNDSDITEGITASNISVSHSWSEGDTKIITSYVKLFDGSVTNSTQNENVDHMLTKINESLLYNPKDLDPNAASDKLFYGSFNDMLSNMCISLGNDQRSTNTMLNSHYTLMIDVDTSRDSVSGVDLNDEAMNMMQFQKAYSAACRLMTAVDEALDRLINNTGIAGR